jgi:hypothetical protein
VYPGSSKKFAGVFLSFYDLIGEAIEASVTPTSCRIKRECITSHRAGRNLTIAARFLKGCFRRVRFVHRRVPCVPLVE